MIGTAIYLSVKHKIFESDAEAPDGSAASIGAGNNKKDCSFKDWSEWDTCDCATKKQSRTRETIPAENGGADCVGDKIEYKDCDEPTGCKKDCSFKDWSGWDTCDCATKKQSRTRETIPAENGGDDCVGDKIEYKDCDEPTGCKKDCSFKDWSGWDTCDCATRKQSRTRETIPAENGGADCVGDKIETKTCGFDEWSNWGNCDCATRKRTRTRKAIPDINGGSDQVCPGSLEESEECKPENCYQSFKDAYVTTGQFIQQYSIPSESECVRDCQKNEQCAATYYYDGGLLCNLINKDNVKHLYNNRGSLSWAPDRRHAYIIEQRAGDQFKPMMGDPTVKRGAIGVL